MATYDHPTPPGRPDGWLHEDCSSCEELTPEQKEAVTRMVRDRMNETSIGYFFKDMFYTVGEGIFDVLTSKLVAGILLFLLAMVSGVLVVCYNAYVIRYAATALIFEPMKLTLVIPFIAYVGVIYVISLLMLSGNVLAVLDRNAIKKKLEIDLDKEDDNFGNYVKSLKGSFIHQLTLSFVLTFTCFSIWLFTKILG